MVASGASGASDGKATGWAVGCAPRNGGGGVLVWKVTSSLRRSRAAPGASNTLPGSCNPSCSRLSAAPAAARDPPLNVGESTAIASRVCGSRISCTPISGDNDGDSVAAGNSTSASVAGATGATCNRISASVAGAGSAAGASAGVWTVADDVATSDVAKVWRSTISAALRSGTPLAPGERDPDASEASRNRPDF